jgi:hypothetical protein
MGLGLAICRTIIEHYGGNLTASSDGKNGASFQFVKSININELLATLRRCWTPPADRQRARWHGDHIDRACARKRSNSFLLPSLDRLPCFLPPILDFCGMATLPSDAGFRIPEKGYEGGRRERIARFHLLLPQALNILSTTSIVTGNGDFKIYRQI